MRKALIALAAVLFAGSVSAQVVISESAAPAGTAGGDLTGTYPNPTVAGIANATNGVKINGGLASDSKSQLLITGVNASAQTAAYALGGTNHCATTNLFANCDFINSTLTWDSTSGYGNNLEGLFQANLTLGAGYNGYDQIVSGTYNSGTGDVALTMTDSVNFPVGQTIYVSSATGTGSFALINGTQVTTASTVGSTVHFTIATGQTLTITGGQVTTAPHVTYVDSCNGWVDNRVSSAVPPDDFNCVTANGAGPNYTGVAGIYNINQFYGKSIGAAGDALPVTGQTVNYNKFISLMSNAATPAALGGTTGNVSGTLNQYGFYVPNYTPPTATGGSLTQYGFYDASTNSPDVFMPGISVGTTTAPPSQGVRSAGSFTGVGGANITGAQINLNNTSTIASNYATQINSGTSTSNVSIGNSQDLVLLGAPTTVTANTANSLTVGPNGTTNPTLNVDSSVTSAATGLNIKAAAAGSGLAVSTVSSGTNESLTIDAKGSGTITLGTVSTGAIVHSRATTLSAALTYGGVTLANSVTGTGSMVLSTSPSLTTPTLGAATATTLNGNTFTTGTYTLTGTAGKTLTFNNSITLAGTDAQTYTFPSVSDTIPGLARAQTWTAANTYTSGSIKFTSTGGPFANGQQIGSGTALATCALGGAGTCSYTTTDGSFSEKITLASASVSTTTLTMTFPNAATNMYVCYGYDFTTPAQRFLQTGGSATTAVMTFYSLAGVAGYASGGASDVLYVACMGN